jgi:lipoprotein-anchoring transpeptidase ErfK/SrfK
MNKMLLLAFGLLPAFSTLAHANDRYRERPPVIVSPDLTAPWVMQLGGQVRPKVYAAGPSTPRAFLQPRARDNGSARRGQAQPVNMRSNKVVRSEIEPQFLPQTVAYETRHAPGTIIIDTNNRFLYLVTGNGQARRYGVGVGKPGFEWAGTHTITRKAEWPRWTPPREMITREAAKGHYLPASMEGGPANPLGARAMYLGSTLYRIHGTNAPWSIGSAVSSGCIRMRNEDVVDLYERVKVGTKVIVI